MSTSVSTYLRVRHKAHKTKKQMQKLKQQQSSSYTPKVSPTIQIPHTMSWFTVGASIFASNFGSDLFIGLSGSGASNGLSVAAFELSALFVMQLATWVFLPVIIVSKVSSLPEYMSKRFGGTRIRTYLAMLAILLYIFTKVSVNLYSGGIFIQQAVGWNLYTSAMFCLSIVALMTMTGGAKGAMLIDQAQALIIPLGASFVAKRAFDEIGGWDGLQHRYANAIPSKVPANLTMACAQTNPRAFQILRPLDDKDMPWLGFLLGQMPANIWYWCTDQSVMQRLLSARSLAHAQGATIFAGYTKALPLILMIIPGMISRVLYTDEVACIDPLECKKYCQSTVSCSNTAYPRLVLELLPLGARGAMVATMVAALISDLCNVFNSATALFTCDVWAMFRRRASRRELSIVGRVFVLVLVAASIMWIPVIQEMQGGQLFIYIQAVGGVFAPPITAVYLCAMFYHRTNECAAFWSLMVGFCVGLYRMTLAFTYKEPSCGQTFDERPFALRIQYMYFALILFFISLASVLIISYFTEPPPAYRLIRTTYWTRFDTSVREDDVDGSIELSSSNKSKLAEQRQSNFSAKSRRTKSLIIRSANKAASDAGDEQTTGANQSEQSERLFVRSPTSETDDDGQTSGRASVLSQAHESLVMNIDEAVQRADKVAQEKMAQEEAREKAERAKRKPPKVLPHQSSLSASAAEAGKFLANKLASSLHKSEVEKQLRGAKDMMKAAASHLQGPSIKFKNLNRDEFDEDDELEDSALDEEEDETFDEESTSGVLSKAVGKKSGKHVGVRERVEEALDDDDGEEEDDDDEDDERVRLNKPDPSSRRFSPVRSNGNKPGGKLSSGVVINVGNKKSPKRAIRDGKSRNRAHFNKANTIDFSTANLTADYSKKRFSLDARKSMSSRNGFDVESSTSFVGIDSSVKMIIKTPFEERILKVALVAIIMFSIGMFTVFSIPPTLT